MTPPTPATPDAAPVPRAGVLTLLLGGLQAIMPLSVDLYLPGLPAIARDLHAAPGAVQATLAVFLVGVALGQLVYGPATDKLGRRPPALFGLALYVVGGVVCALAPGVEALVAGRFLQALGASAGAVVTSAVVRDLWSGKAAADRFSLLMLVMGVAPILAPALGGFLLAFAGWRALFWTLAGLGVLFVGAVALLPETSSPEERARVRFRDTARTYAALLRNAPFVRFGLAGACTSGVLFAYITGSSFVYIEVLGAAPGLYAALFGLNAVGLIAASQLNRALLRRFELLPVTRAALALALGLAVALAALTASGHATLVSLTALLFGLLAALGCTSPNLRALAFDRVRERLGSAAALQGTAQYVTGGLAGGLVGLLGNGAAWPMAAVILGCAALASTLLALAARAEVA